jgi:hypothetical protein
LLRKAREAAVAAVAEQARGSAQAEAAAECPEVVAPGLAALVRAGAQVQVVNLGVYGKVAAVVRAGEAV